MTETKRTFLKMAAAVFVLSVMPLFALDDKAGQTRAETLYINQEFYTAFVQIPSAKRDDYWESKLNYLIMTRARVVRIDSTGRYKRKYRIILNDAEAAAHNLRIMYYVFVDSHDTIDLLSENQVFEFSGQIMGFTPLAMDRNSYALDILLEKGAIIVE